MPDNTKKGFFARMVDKGTALFNYVTTGIWSDPRRNWRINVLRTVNLSVNSFLNRDIQTQACAMTYRTMLAVVPALALLIAIGRGFGMQEVLKEELFKVFPAQRQAIDYAMNFVDSYLAQASEGIFLGVGIVFLLWTVISLISNIEDTFNLIWGQKSGRSIWRKLSDYTAMLLILPVLMLCASGLELLLSSTLKAAFTLSFMTPLVSVFLEIAQMAMTFLFFTAVYILIPNAKVKFLNAFISGIIAGIGFLVLQWLFVSGTLYVAKYNAIYGGLAFLPLLLLWMQLAWVVCLAGAVICYSSQNVFAFSLDKEVTSISHHYLDKVTLAITAVLVSRFMKNERAITALEFMNDYGLPARLVTGITDRLCSIGVCCRVILPGSKDLEGFQLSIDPAQLTVASLFDKLYNLGTSDFITNFTDNFAKVESTFDRLEGYFTSEAQNILITNIEFDSKPIKQTL